MLNVEAEPLVIAFKREVSPRCATATPPIWRFKPCLNLLSTIRWPEEDNCDPLVSALREAAGLTL